ncbi:hypothetical protein, conserved [Eimeria necatrix]|uniref:ATP-dependent RNA helicase DHX29 DSRM-like domain-containing protein n=1 Tax=Eimeria necatrix TaxID=51315 RepID=U6MHU0_9EIME|nr:hypothetical protein, conserved [Eimeria necatrix]CDJ63832.1 hypothetical protein, conserved [Eimeria necatrix]
MYNFFRMPSAPEPSGKEKEGKDKAKTPTPPAEVKTPDRPPGYIEMKPFQRLPKEILHNHCQKHKMPKPQYEQRRAPKGFFKTECILSNPKDSSKTMRFLTNEEFPFKSHSENFSALLALFHLEPSRPYEKLFPSPFREAWLSLSGEMPQQQQQEPAVATAGGSKKPSAKARPAKGTASAQPVAKITAAKAIGAAAEAAAESGNNKGAATGAAQATAEDGHTSGPEAGSPVASVKNEGGGAIRGPRSGPEGPLPASEASPVGGSVGTMGAVKCIQITSAHRYASEFERQQAAETKRLERVKREKEKEMQRLEEEAQMPTVFMAELVRKKTAQMLRELLPHVAATRCEPAAVASAAAAAAAAVSASASSMSGAVSARKTNEDSFLLPLQWTDTKWTAAVTWALRRQLSPQRVLGSLRTKLLKELTEHLQFEKNSAAVAVEAALAALLSGPPQQPQQQQQQTESSAMQQLLESCEDFIALNTTDESLLPPHFSPAGKQIEIRCQTASSQRQEKDQQEQQQKQQLDNKKEKAAMQAARERLAAALKKYTEAGSEGPLRDTLSHLEGALNSLCCSTGLHAIAAGVLEGHLEQQQKQQKQQGPQQAAAGSAAVLSDAFAAVAAAAAAVVGSSEESDRRELLQRLGASRLLADVAVLPITEAVNFMLIP